MAHMMPWVEILTRLKRKTCLQPC
nr:unnamed protein product [Callosobruchus analis]